LLGLEYSPYKWIALEMQTGVETNIEAYGYKRNLIRFANMIALKSNHFVFTGRYSYGSTGILTLRAYYVLNRFGVGALYSTFYGYGPVVQYQIGESPFRVWTSAMYKTNTKEYGAMIGVNFSIKNFVRD